MNLKVDVEGRTYEWRTYDPKYKPSLPRGAVRGNPFKQFVGPFDMPQYFYVDQSRACRTCKEKFTFSAAEQLYWYETLRFRPEVVPVNCLPCRRRKRAKEYQEAQLAAASIAAEDNPKDPATLLAFAEAAARYRHVAGSGRVDLAIAAARKARELPQAILWEAACHAVDERMKRARELLKRVKIAAIHLKPDQREFLDKVLQLREMKPQSD